MKLLLDTHTLIWALYKPRSLSRIVKQALEDPNNEIYFSSISSLEICLKITAKKLKLDAKSALAAIMAVGEKMKEDQAKHRVTVYYLVAEHTKTLSMLA